MSPDTLERVLRFAIKGGLSVGQADAIRLAELAERASDMSAATLLELQRVAFALHATEHIEGRRPRRDAVIDYMRHRYGVELSVKQYQRLKQKITRLRTFLENDSQIVVFE